jgi:hypothetical protein
MPHRNFTDRSGVGWTVSEIAKGLPFAGRRDRRGDPYSGRRPITALQFAMRPFGLPWLCFESSGERRRLARVPARWDELREDQLERLLGESAPVHVA